MRFRFGEFQLDDERFTLAGPAGPVHVEPQVFEMLRHLIINHDRVVSKQELLDAIWGHRFVSESALTSRISFVTMAITGGPPSWSTSTRSAPARSRNIEDGW